MNEFREFWRRPEGAFAAFAFAGVVYAAAISALHDSFYRIGVITDDPIYSAYGLAMRAGELPYRDFGVVYPPGALPAFVIPTYFRDYDEAVWWLMGALGIATVGFVVLCRPAWWAVAYVAVSPLLVGSYLTTRFDLWPTMLLVAALAAFVHDRHRLGWAALAAAFSVKLFPLVVMPVAAVWTWRRRGRRELWWGLGVGALVVAAAFGPFVVLAPHGLYEMLVGQLSRPLQIESLGAAAIMTFSHPVVIQSHGSLNLAGHDALAAISSVVSGLAIVGVWIAFARGPASTERLLRFAAAAVCAFIAFGKVLSPQYLIWLVPIVPLTRGRRGLAATALLTAALVDTQIWFPERYFLYVYNRHLAWLVLLRDLFLVALFLVLSLPAPAPLRSESRVRRRRTRRALPRSAPLAPRPRAGPGVQ